MIQPMLYLDKMELNEMWEVGPGTMIQPNSGCTLAIMAITGHNQNASGLDLACLLAIFFFFLNLLRVKDGLCHRNSPNRITSIISVYQIFLATVSCIV